MVKASKATRIPKINLEKILLALKNSWTTKWYRAWIMQSNSHKSQERFLMIKRILLTAIK